MSIDRRMDKEDVPHIYNGILAIKKEWNKAICSNMERPRECDTSEVGQTEKEK